MHLSVIDHFPPAADTSPRCASCAFLKDCGGLDEPSFLYNCFDVFCCRTGKCDEVCPQHPQYVERLQEVRNIRFDDLKVVEQKYIRLPLYVPHLGHKYARQSPLGSEWVSLSPYQLMRRKGLCVHDPSTLRTLYGLFNTTRVVLRGVDEDEQLERYWATRKVNSLPRLFRALDLALVIAPNFSHFGDVPRPDNLFNRRRQVICIDELVEAGVNVAPHLNDIVRTDWDFWYSYLRDNPTIRLVAKEFQTRCKTVVEGTKAIERLDQLEQRLGRGLHPVIVGGARFTELLAQRFRRFTILDCRATYNAFHRHRFVPLASRGRWQPEQHLPGFQVDALADHNVQTYAKWIAHRARQAVANKHAAARKAG